MEAERLPYEELAVERRADRERPDQALHFEHHVVGQVLRHVRASPSRGTCGGRQDNGARIAARAPVEDGSQDVPHLVTATCCKMAGRAETFASDRQISVMSVQKTRVVGYHSPLN